MADKMKSQGIPQQKLKAFSIGAMGKRNVSKKEMEEMRKKEEEKAAAHAFQQFVETFQEPTNGTSKVWVKAGTYDAGARKEDTREKGKLYKPTSRLVPTQVNTEAQNIAKLINNERKPDRLGKKKEKNFKSNLELFKEELRQNQEEREERRRYKDIISKVPPADVEADPMLKTVDLGSFDTGDPTTTNLYLANLSPKITEQQLMEIFGKYGPLASIKIMWPRTEEEKSRGRNCGFVAYMSRKDGERALRNLSGKDVHCYEMKMGWAKSVVVPTLPIYIPPALLELSTPPPPSGLPFNAQPQASDKDVMPRGEEELQEILRRSVVKVVAPNDRNILVLIHRMVEFVVREGPLFEAMIMNREIHNPMFRFLFEHQSPQHIYYRWKIYSIMHLESQKEWSTREFRMFAGGSIWKPPMLNNYSVGMPDELIQEEEDRHDTKGSLSNTQRDRLEDLIRNLTPESRKVGEAMVFCIEHAEAAEEVTDCIIESLTNESTLYTKKMARLYLVSDILHNCTARVTKAILYKKTLEHKLIVVMKSLKLCCDTMDTPQGSEGFKVRVLRTIKAWENNIYPKKILDMLKCAFLGITEDMLPKEEERQTDIDGDPLQDGRDLDDADDVPMDGAALLKSALKHQLHQVRTNAVLVSPAASPPLGASPDDEDDIDGEVIQDNDSSFNGDKLGGAPQSAATAAAAATAFVKSKWETVDLEDIQAQAMTTSKWDLLDHSAAAASLSSAAANPAATTSSTAASATSDSRGASGNDSDADIDGVQIGSGSDAVTALSDLRAMTEARRLRLREIEVKAMLYQDELESKQRALKPGWTLQQQVDHYRRRLLRRADRAAASSATVAAHAAAASDTEGGVGVGGSDGSVGGGGGGSRRRKRKHERSMTTAATASDDEDDVDRSRRSNNGMDEDDDDDGGSARRRGNRRRRRDDDRSAASGDDDVVCCSKENTSRKHKKHARRSRSGSPLKYRSPSRSKVTSRVHTRSSSPTSPVAATGSSRPRTASRHAAASPPPALSRSRHHHRRAAVSSPTPMLTSPQSSGGGGGGGGGSSSSIYHSSRYSGGGSPSPPPSASKRSSSHRSSHSTRTTISTNSSVARGRSSGRLSVSPPSSSSRHRRCASPNSPSSSSSYSYTSRRRGSPVAGVYNAGGSDNATSRKHHKHKHKV